MLGAVLLPLLSLASVIVSVDEVGRGYLGFGLRRPGTLLAADVVAVCAYLIPRGEQRRAGVTCPPHALFQLLPH